MNFIVLYNHIITNIISGVIKRIFRVKRHIIEWSKCSLRQFTPDEMFLKTGDSVRSQLL